MPALSTPLRNQLEKTVVAARDAAETAAAAALLALAVGEALPHAGTSTADNALRENLRAEAERLGSGTIAAGLDELAAECAYVQWHCMLFARFLAENDLLIYSDGSTPITLADCAELAREEGDADAYAAAARFASAMLPGIFRPEDPALQVRFAAEGRLALEKLLKELPDALFRADDSLGWVYQFWQAKRKDEVNKSGVKIGGADISAVTQLFTEHYMVQFLLHNTLGAWWAARHPDSPLVAHLTYLRLKQDGSPAAGNFNGWPRSAAALRVMDPSCGSGHFLVEAFALLRRFRMHEEGYGETEAGDKVLAENLFGLELDARCSQIAQFNLVLAAWKAGGYRKLPEPQVACSGLAVGGDPEEWAAVAGGDVHLQTALLELYNQFKDAPNLGSLIDPRRSDGGFVPLVGFDELSAKLLTAAEQFGKDGGAAASIFGQTARGAVQAVRLLSGRYHLVTTNVPYLARGKQGTVLADFCARQHPAAKGDLATAFVERCLSFCEAGGSTALVTPQNWLFLGSYKKLREKLLQQETWSVVSRLGPGAFETIGGEVVNIALVVLSHATHAQDHEFAGIDASEPRVPAKKALLLREGELKFVSQSAQLDNPDARVVMGVQENQCLLQTFAFAAQGLKTGDDSLHRRCFWEIAAHADRWRNYQSTVNSNSVFGGCEHVIDWATSGSNMGRLQGLAAWGKQGVAVSQMRDLSCALYRGDIFDSNMSPIVPHKVDHLPAIWCFCSSPEFNVAVRHIDQKLNVTNSTLVKVPFDIARWQKVADEKYPGGLPEPHSDDPTQWLFDGDPVRARIGDEVGPAALQVAVARLLGYRWPQNDDDALDVLTDADGIVCLPAVAGEPPAAERLRALLAAAWGQDWSPAVQQSLLDESGYSGSLDGWLREKFFATHCSIFHNRPFIWQIWDGQREGFSVLVNYHKFDRAALQRLIYSYLEPWIKVQADADKAGEPGANARLVAAQALQKKLGLVLDGEPPYDIYVRWKTLAEQPIGWEPDLNDGVRMNIRPFVTAGVLRAKFTINWNKDRGTNPDGSERFNDLHYSRAEKEQARAADA